MDRGMLVRDVVAYCVTRLSLARNSQVISVQLEKGLELTSVLRLLDHLQVPPS